jgi:hypothetical protein
LLAGKQIRSPNVDGLPCFWILLGHHLSWHRDLR